MALKRKKWDACRERRALARLPMSIARRGMVPYHLLGERDRLLAQMTPKRSKALG